MSRSRFERRFVCDLVVTFFLVALLSVLFLIMLNLDINLEILGNLSPLIIALVLVITVSHSVSCLSRSFFWKFAFLLPDEIYYHILAKVKYDLDEKMAIDLTNSKLISSNPEPEPNSDKQKNSNTIKFKIDASSNCEAEGISLWLQKKGDEILKITNGENFDTFKRYNGSNSSKFGPYSFCLLFSKNVILLLGRSLLLTFLFLFILLHNPPLMIAADPTQIQENWTEGENHSLVISAKNIGCDLWGAKLICMNSSKEQFITAKWSAGENPIKLFESGDVKFINLGIDGKSPPGEYAGSIIVRAKANRTIGLFPFDHPLVIGQTSAKKIVEVPFFIRITPKLNSIGR